MGFTVKNSLIAVVRIIDGFNEWVGRAVSWLVVLMVINVFCVVVLRYIFSVGWIWMQETYVWMHGTVFMLGAGYTLLHDGHVRIDLFYREASAKYKAAVNLVGSLFMALPLIWITFDKSWPIVVRSWESLERSAEAGGLPALYLFKSVIIGFCILFGVQFIALAMRSLLILLDVEMDSAEQQGGEA